MVMNCYLITPTPLPPKERGFRMNLEIRAYGFTSIYRRGEFQKLTEHEGFLKLVENSDLSMTLK